MRNNTGFTLIELMIVVAIVAILAAIAYPSYTNYAYRSRRSDGKAWLTQMTFAQERYYTSFNTYTDDVDKLLGTHVSERQYYTGAVTVGDGGQAFTATVTPQGIQASDQCGQLSVTNLGDHGFTGTQTNGNCW